MSSQRRASLLGSERSLYRRNMFLPHDGSLSLSFSPNAFNFGLSGLVNLGDQTLSLSFQRL